MSQASRPSLHLPPCSIASESLSGFVAQAEKVLKSGHNVLTVEVPAGHKIGEIFARAVVDVALESQIESVEKRYGISLSHISHQVNCLRVQDILAFASGILHPTLETSHEMEPQFIFGVNEEKLEKASLAKRHFEMSSFSRSLLGRQISRINLDQYASLISSDALRKLTLDKLSQQLSNQTLDINQLQEVLSKLFGTSALEVGMRIPLPALIDPATGEKIPNNGYYQVYKKISKEGLMAFALTPIDAPEFVKPTVLFRPTALSAGEKNALKTIAEDMHDDVGKYGFDAAKEDLELLMMDPFFISPGEKGWISGFSLGGAHAARLLAFAPDKFAKAFFFNDPSTEKTLAEEFATRLLHTTHTASNPLDIRIFHNESDDVTLVGAMHVGYIPESFPFKKRASSLCRVQYVKIQTRHAEALTGEVRSLAQVDISFRNILSLTSRASRVAALEFARIKKQIHCQIVLSSFNQQTDEDPRQISLESAPSSPRSRASSDPKSPKSPSALEPVFVDIIHLDKSTCPLATQFNQKRLSLKIATARSVVKFCCRKFAELKNILAMCRKAIGGFFARFSRSHSKSYIPLIEEKFKQLKDVVYKIDLSEFLSVPQAGNPKANAQSVDLSELFMFLSVPEASR
jgi:hypothetical protein